MSRGGTGSTVFGSDRLTSPEWAAWANGVAVRELDFHDTFLAAEYSHPGDNIPSILAVAQHLGRTGSELLRGIVTGYEIQVDLVKAISLHKHKIDHVAHLGPSAAAGIGTLTRGRRSRQVKITELTAEESRPVLRAFPVQVPVGVMFAKSSGLVTDGTPDEFEALAGRLTVFRFDPVVSAT